MNIHFNAQSIQKACDLISGDMNLFLSHQQMVELLSTNPSLFEAVNDGGLSGLFCPEKNNPILINYNDPENYSLGRAPDVVSFFFHYSRYSETCFQSSLDVSSFDSYANC